MGCFWFKSGSFLVFSAQTVTKRTFYLEHFLITLLCSIIIANRQSRPIKLWVAWSKKSPVQDKRFSEQCVPSLNKLYFFVQSIKCFQTHSAQPPAVADCSVDLLNVSTRRPRQRRKWIRRGVSRRCSLRAHRSVTYRSVRGPPLVSESNHRSSEMFGLSFTPLSHQQPGSA